MILVNHRGARTGVEYTAPLVYTRDGDSYVVIASKGGAPEDPQWFRNLVANPDITVEVGADTIPVRARVAEGDERARLFRAQADAMPNFDEYAKATGAVLDSYLTASSPFREMLEKSMLRVLEQLSMPSRPDFIALAQRITNIEMRLDDMDAKLDQILKQSKAKAPNARAASGKKR